MLDFCFLENRGNRFTRRRSLVRVQQSPPKVPEIARFQEFFFCIPNFFLLIYFCPFSATNTLTNMAIVPEQHLVSYSLWRRDGRSG